MKKENKGVKFLTGFLAFILSIVLILSCVATVIVAGVTSMLKPDNIIKLVRSIDFAQIFSEFTPEVIPENAIGYDLRDVYGDVADETILDEYIVDGSDIEDAIGGIIEGVNKENIEVITGDDGEISGIILDGNEIIDIEDVDPAIKDVLDLENGSDIGGLLEGIQLPEGVDEEMLNALLQSNAAKDIVEEYTNGLSAVLSGEAVVEEFTVEDVKKIVDDNMDEIIGIAKNYVGEELSEEEIEAKINEIVDTMAGDVLSSLPSFKDMQQQFEGGLSSALKVVSSPILTYICIGICTLIGLLIFACRARRCRGLIWLAVDCFIAGGLVSLVRSGFDLLQPMLVEAADSMLGEASTTIVESLFGVLLDPIHAGQNILFAVASAFVIIFIVIHVVLANIEKKKLAAEGIVADPMLQDAVASAEDALVAKTEESVNENVENNV